MTAIHAVDAVAPTEPIDAALEAVLQAPLPDAGPGLSQPGHGLVFHAFLRPHQRGLHHYLVEHDLPTSVDPLAVLPTGSRVLRAYRRSGSREVLAAYDGCLVVIRSWTQSADVWVSGREESQVERIVQEIRDKVPPAPTECEVRVTFWHSARNAWSRTRSIEVPSWDEVSVNYPPVVRDVLCSLVGFRPSSDQASGRLLLWHGPPGTGKTSAVRALLDAWRSWSTAHVVSDPEQLLNDGDYMARVLLNEDDEGEDDNGEQKWRLVVIEDAEELLRNDARAKVGSALGRLLNTADGLLGQGTRVLILLTTNEAVVDMHPALLRPGRCLARIEFPAFNADEASAFLGERVSKPMTLAELMEHKGSLSRLEVQSEVERPGLYL